MDIKVSRAFRVIANEAHVFCGCADGIIRVFNKESLVHVTTFPRPPALGNYNVFPKGNTSNTKQ